MAALRHRWDLTPAAAIRLQQSLRGRVETQDRLNPVRLVAGVDVGFEENGRVAKAAVAVLTFPGLALADCAFARERVRFPYVPGLLSFREAPAILAALRALKRPPDLILADGQGIAHPRRFGIASHLGLAAGIPTIGVAKSRLVGTHRNPAVKRGAKTLLKDGRETIGVVLRTQTGVKPLYVSIGHRVGIATAVRYVLACAPRYRLPETTRWAHRLASVPAHEAEAIRLAIRRGRAGRAR